MSNTKISVLPDLAVRTLIGDGETGEETSLGNIRGNKAMVIDFWHTKCTRCPAALEKLDKEAANPANSEILFVSCALSQGDGNYDVAADLVCDGSFENLTHVFMEMAVKEEAKAAFGFTSVPFYVVVNKRGEVIGAGEPKAVDYKALLAASDEESAENKANAAASAPEQQTGLVFDEDF